MKQKNKLYINDYMNNISLHSAVTVCEDSTTITFPRFFCRLSILIEISTDFVYLIQKFVY